MEVDTVIIRNMVVVMDMALLVDTDILMEGMVTEACANTVEVTGNMEDTEITDTNRKYGRGYGKYGRYGNHGYKSKYGRYG